MKELNFDDVKGLLSEQTLDKINMSLIYGGEIEVVPALGKKCIIINQGSSCYEPLPQDNVCIPKPKQYVKECLIVTQTSCK